eukprot:gene30259-37440_t
MNGGSLNWWFFQQHSALIQASRLEEVEKIRARKLKRTVDAIAGKLRQWQQEEDNDSNLMLDLEDDSEPQITTELLLAQFSQYLLASGDSDEELGGVDKETSDVHQNNRGHNLMNDILPTVQALSVVQDRAETLKTVDKLTKLCNFGGEVRLAAVKEMMSAGALQCLLSTLERADGWPEVELQISKVISVLVTYEDDWALLQRSAYAILSALYVYIQKTQAKTLEQNSDREINRNKFNDNNTNVYKQNNNTQEHVIQSTKTSSSHHQSSRPRGEEAVLEDVDAIASDGDSASIQSSDSSDRCVVDELEHNELLKLSDHEDQTNDVRALVSAAVTKLTLVLSSEWSRLDDPLGNNRSQSDNKHAIPAATNTNGRMEFVRDANSVLQKTPITEPNTPSGFNANFTRPRTDSNADSKKILEVLLNLIVTMSESSLLSIQYNANIASVYENNDYLFSQQNKNQLSYNVQPGGQPNGNLHFPSETYGIDMHNEQPSNGAVRSRGQSSDDNGRFTQPAIDDPYLKKLPIQVDNSTVLCSAALSNLAEISQCRPDLVTGGALKIIKSWLEIGIEVLAHAKAMCFHDYESATPSLFDTLKDPALRKTTSRKVSASFVDFMRTYGTAYELISNAAAAIMYLSGGCDVRFHHTSNSSGKRYYGTGSNPLEGSGGRDYIIGWIDAQIIAEGLPAIIVKLITTSIEDFTTLDDPVKSTRSVLPAAVGMHLSQTLYQLCSRTQNRRQLKICNIPFALCMLFENIVSQVRNTSFTNSSRLDVSIHDTIYACIFDFNGIYYQNSSASDANNRDWEESTDSFSMYQDVVTTFSNISEKKEDEGLSGTSKPHLSKTWVRVIGETSSSNSSESGSRDRNAHHNEHTPINDNDSTMLVMSSITSSCLDALTFFFSDEVAKLPYTVAVNRLTKAKLPLPEDISLEQQKSESRMLNLPSVSDMIHTTGLIDLMSTSLKALYEGSVVDVLALICGEAHPASVNALVVTNGPSRLPVNGKKEMPSRPGAATRGISNVSSLSNGSKEGKNKTSSDGASETTGDTPRIDRYAAEHSSGSKALSGDVDEEDDDLAANSIKNIAMEEMLIMAYSLANLCEANVVYATRMFNTGVFTLMTKLIRSEHSEIQRQALRCMSAMCPIINNEAIERAIFVKPKKNTMFFEALDALTFALMSSSPLVQKGAVNTISQLALINEQIQDSIVEGPLRSIISILMNPKNNRMTRAA